VRFRENSSSKPLKTLHRRAFSRKLDFEAENSAPAYVSRLGSRKLDFRTSRHCTGVCFSTWLKKTWLEVTSRSGKLEKTWLEVASRSRKLEKTQLEVTSRCRKLRKTWLEVTSRSRKLEKTRLEVISRLRKLKKTRSKSRRGREN
jgi:hypothetical protein